MDIRLDVNFFESPKTIKLQRRLGLEGVTALIRLWTWAAKNRAEGDLSGLDDEDIEIAAGWIGSGDRSFASTLNELHWLDGEPGHYVLHQWRDHNSWAAGKQARSDWARLLKMGDRWPQLYDWYILHDAEGIAKEEYERAVAEFKEGRWPDGCPVVDVDSLPVQQEDNAPLSCPLTPPPPPPPSPAPELNDRDPIAAIESARDEAKKRGFEKLLWNFPGWQSQSGDEAFIRQLHESGVRDPVRVLRDAIRWVRRKNFQVNNARAFLTDWFMRVQKEQAKGGFGGRPTGG